MVGTEEGINAVVALLTVKYEMRDLGKTTFCIGLQIEDVCDGIFVHQSTYVKKILKRFNMDQANAVKSPMVVRTLNASDDAYGPRKEGEDVLGPEYPYLAAIGALMYLANGTRPDIAFAVNLLSRFSNEPTKRLL